MGPLIHPTPQNIPCYSFSGHRTTSNKDNSSHFTHTDRHTWATAAWSSSTCACLDMPAVHISTHTDRHTWATAAWSSSTRACLDMSAVARAVAPCAMAVSAASPAWQVWHVRGAATSHIHTLTCRVCTCLYVPDRCVACAGHSNVTHTLTRRVCACLYVPGRCGICGAQQRHTHTLTRRLCTCLYVPRVATVVPTPRHAST